MVTVANAKQHLRVETDAEDNLILGFIDAAKDHFQSIGVDVTADPLPPAIYHAILLMVGHFYENREAVTDQPAHVLPLGVARLIAPYRSVNL